MYTVIDNVNSSCISWAEEMFTIILPKSTLTVDLYWPCKVKIKQMIPDAVFHIYVVFDLFIIIIVGNKSAEKCSWKLLCANAAMQEIIYFHIVQKMGDIEKVANNSRPRIISANFGKNIMMCGPFVTPCISGKNRVSHICIGCQYSIQL